MSPANRKPRRTHRRRRAAGFSVVTTRPRLALGLVGLGAVLAWLVLTTTLPYALATDRPDIALTLNPNNPVALAVVAERRRAAYLHLLQRDRPAEGRDDVSSATTSDGAVPDDGTHDARLRQLRSDIRALAVRLLRVDPLNATAYRLLGEVAPDTEQTRAAMQAAVARSRREMNAVFWLLHDSFVRGAYPDVIKHAEALLRPGSQLAGYATRYLAGLIETDEGRELLADRLRERPDWRGVFLGRLGREGRNPAAALQLMIALKRAESPPTIGELRPLLDRLMREQNYAFAYNVWLQLLPPDQLATVRRVNNGEFSLPASGSPFDWHMTRARNAFVEVAADPLSEANQALYLNFPGGRAQNVGASQVLMLAPGRYELRGQMRGKITAKRGLRWRVGCLGAGKRLIGQSEMLYEAGPGWQPFAFAITVPTDTACVAQRLRLIHDARSASEELIRGTFWFDTLSVVSLRAAPDAPAPTSPVDLRGAASR